MSEAYLTGLNNFDARVTTAHTERPHEEGGDYHMVLDQFEESECAALYPPHRHLRHGYDHETQMCYGSLSYIVDTCEGDSGGPLQYNRDYIRCLFHIMGVTSYGKDCGILGSAGMYTRVSYYVPWIESVVWPEETEARRNQDNQWLDKWLHGS